MIEKTSKLAELESDGHPDGSSRPIAEHVSKAADADRGLEEHIGNIWCLAENDVTVIRENIKTTVVFWTISGSQ